MSKRVKLTVNSKVKELLQEKNISIHDGLGYLMCLYYGIEPTYIPDRLKKQVLACNIVSKDFNSDTITWKQDLFEETVKGFEWITEWMDMFKMVNPARRGTKAYVLKRMKKFFVNNPHIRKEEVMRATKKYLSSLENPVYCKSSHKFIYEQDGSSMLEAYIELAADDKKRTNRIVI